MAKIPILIALLLCMLIEVFGQSPCPEYFTYITDPVTNEVMGQIQIPSPPKYVDIHLKVGLSIGVALPTKYVGQVELAQSKEDSVQTILQGKPLLYHVHFPMSRPISVVVGIWFNEQKICSGPRAEGRIVTSIVLEHTLYPPNSVPFSQTPSPGSIYEIHSTYTTTKRPTTNRRPTKKSTTPRPPETTTVSLSQGIDTNIFLNPPSPPLQSNNNECGISSPKSDIVNPLIAKGTETWHGQWPWLIAIFIVKITHDFQCAGSILTNRHIITAAHCFKLSDNTDMDIPPAAMLVSLGRYRLRDFRESGSENREVASYKIHPDYNHSSGNGDSDLAIMVLRTSVEFSLTIKPICLWSGPTSLQSVVNKLGYVVGWGRDELGNLYREEPRMARVPIASQEQCLWSDSRFITFTSNRTFCAGLQDGSGPCNGDSGSGLVLQDTNTGRYQLRGIVSRSLFNDVMFCDLTKYVVYLDVASYIPWIQRQLSTT